MPSIQATARSMAPSATTVAVPEGQHHLGRVVDVGVVVVGELESPPAGGQAGRRMLQSPLMVTSSPSSQAPARRMPSSVGRRARIGQPDHGQGRVPHRGLAGLEPAAGLVVDGEGVQPVQAGTHHGMIERVALQVQRHQRVDPRRLDPAPGAVGLLALDDPPLGPLQGQLAQDGDGLALVDMERPIELLEPPAPPAGRPAGGRFPLRSSSMVTGIGRTGRWALITVRAATVWRAQQPKS